MGTRVSAPMTRTEARLLLIGAYPRCTVFVTIQDAHYGDLSYANLDEILYRVSVLPGLHGETCSQWTADTLSGAVRQALDAARQEPPTGEQQDDYFARPSDALEKEAAGSCEHCPADGGGCEVCDQAGVTAPRPA